MAHLQLNYTIPAIVGAVAGALVAYIASIPSDRVKMCEKAISTVLTSPNPKDTAIASYLIKKFDCRIVFKGL